MKTINATIAGYSVNVLNNHMLMILAFDIPANTSATVKTTTDFKTWNVIQTIPAAPNDQQLQYSLDLTAGQAVFVFV